MSSTTSKWKEPPAIKVYEALGAIGDGRVEVNGNSAKVYSSSRGKYYVVTYDTEKGAIMANDNGSYWKGYLGYPSIAFLLLAGVVEYNEHYAELLKDIPWKDINQKYKNDFEKTLNEVLAIVQERGGSVEDLQEEVHRIVSECSALGLSYLGSKVRPPEGY
jgi:hypothetical protein